jgi:SAM-dependent methyltransferase
MRIWNPLRHWLPRSLRDEARELVARVSRATWEPLRLQSEEQHKELSTRLDGLRSELTEMQTLLVQLCAILRHLDPTLLPPPRHLQVRVVGSYVPQFIESGFSICRELNSALLAAGKTLADFPRILDFGCGCGRMTRALKAVAPSAELHGIDIDPEAIAWLKANYGRFAEYRLAPHQPPTSFEKDFFDFVVGISVFTHLPEDMQFRWLEELNRITKPGGYLVLTTSGEKNYKRLPAEQQEILNTRGFFYTGAEKYGQSISLPDFYQNTFHSHPYLRREWTRYFDVIAIRAAWIDNDQDAILLRKRL